MKRGKIISLISASSGKPKYVIAKRTRACCKCNTPILAGKKCVEIPKVGGAYTNWKRFCLSCFQLVIEKTMSDLNELKKGLSEM